MSRSGPSPPSDPGGTDPPTRATSQEEEGKAGSSTTTATTLSSSCNGGEGHLYHMIDWDMGGREGHRILLHYLTTSDLLRLSECCKSLLRYRCYLSRIKVAVPSSSAEPQDLYPTTTTSFLHVLADQKRQERQLQPPPIEHLRIGHESLIPILNDLLRPGALQIKVLDLSSIKLTDEDRRLLGYIMSKGGLKNLEQLDLSRGRSLVTTRGFTYITTALAQGCCPALRRLDLSRNQLDGIGQAIAEALGSGHLGNIEELDLSCTELAPDNLVHIAMTLLGGACPNLRSLKLEGCNQSRADARAIGLALKSRSCPRLEVLSMSYEQDIGEQGLMLLLEALEAGACPNLRALHLRHVFLTARGSAMFARALASPGCSRLRRLEMPGAFQDPVGSLRILEAIKSRACPDLRVLNLHATHLAEDHYRLLGQALLKGACPKLEELVLSDCEPMAGEGLVHMREALMAGHCRDLRHLDMEFSGMRSHGALALSSALACGSFAALQRLELAGNSGIGDVAMAEIIKSLSSGCHELLYISLSFTGLGLEAGRALLQALRDNAWPHLQDMEAADESLGLPWVRGLASTLAEGAGLRLGKLGIHCPSSDGFSDLACTFQAGACPNLRELYISTAILEEDEPYCFDELRRSLEGRAKLSIG